MVARPRDDFAGSVAMLWTTTVLLVALGSTSTHGQLSVCKSEL